MHGFEQSSRMKQSIRTGIIDMGTNTFHLLIGGSKCKPLEIIHSEKIAVRLGKGGISSGKIAESAITRAIDTLHSFVESATQLGVSNLQAFATSAMRNASNAPEVMAKIKTETDISVQVIDGETEALNIFSGVKAAMDLASGYHLIMDIGGGSVEFIFCTQKSILWKKSFEIGVQRLKDRFQQNDPIKQNEIDALNMHFNSSLSELADKISIYKPTILVGCSGTFGTLSDIYEIRNNIPSSRSTSEGNFDLNAFPGIYEELITNDYNKRMEIAGMSTLRADMIVVAVILLRWVINEASFNDIRISHYAMKEGILYESLNCKKYE